MGPGSEMRTSPLPALGGAQVLTGPAPAASSALWPDDQPFPHISQDGLPRVFWEVPSLGRLTFFPHTMEQA